MRLIGILGLFALAFATWKPIFALDNTVRTAYGSVRGSGTDVKVFKGIPYAAPPVGRLRWRPPEPPPAWQGTRDAIEFSPACPQPAFAIGKLPQSEDCLDLNIWTPAKDASDRLPVIVWVHGGGFFMGSGAQPGFAGEAFVRRGVVLVTLNYRLGGLGFLAHPALSRESSQGVSGNYGLLDEIAALQWVQQNISRFGGNPRNVTMAGQSAGAVSAALLMVSPLVKGLFQRAIMETPPLLFGPFAHLREKAYNLPSQEHQGEQELSDLAAMRAKPPAEIIAQLRTRSFFGAGVYYYPIVDGWLVPADPSELFGTRNQQSTPVLMGVDSDEANFYARLAPKTLAEYHSWVGREFPGFVDRILSMYPAVSDQEASEMSLRVLDDFTMQAPMVLTARAISKKSPTYVYHFSRVSPLNQKRWHGAAHGVEIPYAFNAIDVTPGEWEEQDQALSTAMADAWVQFARTGDPNLRWQARQSFPGSVKWPAYSAPGYQHLEFGDTTTVKSGVRDPQVSFWAHIFEEMRRADKAKPEAKRRQ